MLGHLAWDLLGRALRVYQATCGGLPPMPGRIRGWTPEASCHLSACVLILTPKGRQGLRSGRVTPASGAGLRHGLLQMEDASRPSGKDSLERQFWLLCLQPTAEKLPRFLDYCIVKADPAACRMCGSLSWSVGCSKPPLGGLWEVGVRASCPQQPSGWGANSSEGTHDTRRIH